MERPIMHPVSAFDPTEAPLPHRRPVAWRALRLLGRLLMASMLVDVLHPLRRRAAFLDDEKPLWRLGWAVIYRLLFVPVVLVLFAAAMVWAGTHPESPRRLIDPICQGVYYDPVAFSGTDGVRVDGWLVPVLDASRILAKKEKSLSEHHPALVLVHDCNSTRQQLLPLVGPLHDAGYVVLLISLGGSDANSRAVSTFGLNEAGDVRGAIELLRHTPFVDPSRIGLIGIGTGATASLLASERDPAIAAVIADQPAHSGDQVVARYIGPAESWLQWINPLCKWSFNITYGVDCNDINLDRSLHALQSRPALIFDDQHPVVLQSTRTRSLLDFLNQHLQNTGVARSE